MNHRRDHNTLLGRSARMLEQMLRETDLFATTKIDFPEESERGYDLRLVGTTKVGTRVEFYVECKVDPRPVHFPYANIEREFLDGKTKRAKVPVLAAPVIGPRMAEVCWDHGWGWFDLAGNVRISVPGILYLERKGNESKEERPPARANLSTHASARVIRILLDPENARREWSQLDLHLHVGDLEKPEELTPPSLGLVNKVVRELIDSAFLTETERGVKVADAVGLLKAWTDVYRFDHQQFSYFTLLKGPALRNALAQLESVSGGHAAYASFSAAERLAPNVRQPKTWLYVSDRHLNDFARLAEAKVVDSGANLTVLLPRDDGVFYGQRGVSGDLAWTGPVQTYVDLRHSGGRGEEAAEAILEMQLKPAWLQGGILK